MGVGGAGDGDGDGDCDGWSRESLLLDGGGGGGSGGTELGFDGVGREAPDGTEGQGGRGLFLKEDEAGMALGLEGEEEEEEEDAFSLRGVGREALSFFVQGGGGGGGLRFGIGGGGGVGLCLVLDGGGGIGDRQREGDGLCLVVLRL